MKKKTVLEVLAVIMIIAFVCFLPSESAKHFSWGSTLGLFFAVLMLTGVIFIIVTINRWEQKQEEAREAKRFQEIEKNYQRRRQEALEERQHLNHYLNRKLGRTNRYTYTRPQRRFSLQ